MIIVRKDTTNISFISKIESFFYNFLSSSILMPGFLSPNVAKVLVENFGIGGIGTVEEDIKRFGI